MLFSILILLFYNLQQVLPTNDKLDETALYKLILDQCVDKPELCDHICNLLSIFDRLKEQNAKLTDAKNCWQTNYWTLWVQNYVSTNLISPDQNGIVHIESGELDSDFMQFVLHGRMPGQETVVLARAVKFNKYYFDQLIMSIAMTDLPHLVMDLRMDLPEPFKCPDACYILSGFVDTLSFRELFPYCTDAEFVEQSAKAKIKTIKPKLIGVNQEEYLIRFLIKNPNALNFEIQLHYSPINENKWTQMMITQLSDN